jgi:prolyl-tRNA editing enzyme YbaK/EbsC (Cys-tRNA(Pro) deacylase)
MEDPQHRNAVRVQDALRAAGSSARVRRLDDSARTAPEAAAALGVEVGAIAKSLVFQADSEPVLVVMSGADRCDTARLAAELGAERVRRPDADVVRAATGYPIGGVSPAGLPAELTVLVDRGLAAFDVVWAAAGTPHDVFPTTFDELLALTGGRPTDVREEESA